MCCAPARTSAACVLDCFGVALSYMLLFHSARARPLFTRVLHAWVCLTCLGLPWQLLHAQCIARSWQFWLAPFVFMSVVCQSGSGLCATPHCRACSTLLSFASVAYRNACIKLDVLMSLAIERLPVGPCLWLWVCFNVVCLTLGMPKVHSAPTYWCVCVCLGFLPRQTTCMHCNAPLRGSSSIGASFYPALSLSYQVATLAGVSRPGVCTGVHVWFWRSCTSCCATPLTDASAAGCSPQGEYSNAAALARPSGQADVVHCPGLCPHGLPPGHHLGVIWAVS